MKPGISKKRSLKFSVSASRIKAPKIPTTIKRPRTFCIKVVLGILCFLLNFSLSIFSSLMLLIPEMIMPIIPKKKTDINKSKISGNGNLSSIKKLAPTNNGHKAKSSQFGNFKLNNPAKIMVRNKAIPILKSIKKTTSPASALL
nr:hypothetical protein [uncultured Flavobacterium sp.]